VAVAHAEVVQVGDQVTGVAKREVSVELEAVRRSGNAPPRETLSDQGFGLGRQIGRGRVSLWEPDAEPFAHATQARQQIPRLLLTILGPALQLGVDSLAQLAVEVLECSGGSRGGLGRQGPQAAFGGTRWLGRVGGHEGGLVVLRPHQSQPLTGKSLLPANLLRSGRLFLWGLHASPPLRLRRR